MGKISQKSKKKNIFKSFFFWSFKMSIWCFPEGDCHQLKSKERVRKPKCWTRFLQIKWGICSTRGCLEQPDCQFIIEENSHWFLHFFPSKKDFFARNLNILTNPQFCPKTVPKRLYRAWVVGTTLLSSISTFWEGTKNTLFHMAYM